MEIFQAQPLDKVYDLVQGFSCGNKYIDDYLTKTYYAYNDHIKNLTTTTTIIDTEKDRVAAFISTRCASLNINKKEAQELGLVGEYSVPAIEIRFLAVNKAYQKQGLGEKILQSIVGKAIELSRHFGCRYVFLWAVPEPEVIEFYQKRKFEFMNTVDEETELCLMRFLIPEIDNDWLEEV
ncbi:GNAT family N-acetyltransferase [Bacillus methanolicus]|uniref:N-acetyltransferase domain-containing protein n=1 Tax=Bacillus methanolicus (strain MGA3 / ATCC 53907) TaxID=796606 RepID=I3EBT3_BACMM|nr:GNAT family N-acetyltransferase [Bacillus methanolicus]AIE61635.1 hypothetical protein BMMGA3_16410 [Bacillus methanolicus MGA3]EIJ83954.1 hypothetical protein MGA3_01640 [Bacillus methanolicus MGA3]